MLFILLGPFTLLLFTYHNNAIHS